ncbi:hypothetical protein H2201_008515 [Coniosporium apollinis]|uniref:Uncharacterized protein n=1 Tax=Coniosporium apollinis TaxID=61459 RepID=A0ABQ9NIS1_9PEZI|nr:hypothetical protein H2201_008515 [Coniosporium apollinis]
MTTFLQFQISGSLFAACIKVLTVLGALYTSTILWRLGTFTWTHFIRTGTISRYKTTTSGKPPWAIVTGASDGVGQGFAEALAAAGFNVILHGRDEQKLQALVEALQPCFPDRQFDFLIIDGLASVRDAEKMQAALERLKDREIRVLINNLGGHGGAGNWLALTQEQSASTMDAWIDLTARFPAQFTRLLLPQLIRNKPALIQNIGSASADMPSPWLALYSACKAFNKAWSQSLQVELMAQNHDIEVQNITAANISTRRSKRTESWLEPNPRKFAESALGTVGCRSKVVWGYAAHAPMLTILNSLPESIRDKLIIKEMSRIVAKEQQTEK